MNLQKKLQLSSIPQLLSLFLSLIWMGCTSSLNTGRMLERNIEQDSPSKKGKDSKKPVYPKIPNDSYDESIENKESQNINYSDDLTIQSSFQQARKNISKVSKRNDTSLLQEERTKSQSWHMLVNNSQQSLRDYCKKQSKGADFNFLNYFL